MLINHQLDNIQKYNVSKQLDIKLPLVKFNRMLVLRRITEAVMVTLFTYVGLYLGPLDAMIKPVWPHTGILIGILFLRGSRITPWLFLGSALAYWQASSNWAYAITMGALTGFSSYLFYVASLSFVGPIAPLNRVKPLIKMTLLILLFAPLIGFTTFITTNYFIAATYPAHLLVSTMFSCTISLMIFTPICLIWDTFIPGGSHSKKEKAIILLLTLLVLATHISFCMMINMTWIITSYIASLILAWIGLIFFGQFGCCIVSVATALFLLSVTGFPAYAVIKVWPHALEYMQAGLLVNVWLTLLLATKQKESYFKHFIDSFTPNRNTIVN